jgi:hypothetical protein
MVCRNICERMYSKVVFGISNYSLGQKYCRRCEVYMYNNSMFCPCCGMQLRLSPSSREYKEILRERKATLGKWLITNGTKLQIKIFYLKKSSRGKSLNTPKGKKIDLFSKMLTECGQNEDYIRAAVSKDEYFSAESLFMILTSKLNHYRA